jgi:elongation factor 2
MMPRFQQTSEILKLMHRRELVRNVGVIAHIDHGKTTLTDSLLIEAGLLPTRIAGSPRVLDYLQEEQKRGITIKTANISFLHRMGEETYLINLVDTPGHVDFVGKVTRALRAIDGAIVVVDAVEEIMAQTETVTRQALEERVKPVLFINKVDRLIQELRLSSSEIRQKFIHIINDFNNIIEIYGEPEFKRKWKVYPRKGTVVFGSALHRWGFTTAEAESRGIRFDDSAQMEFWRKGNFEQLSRAVPLQKAILEMVAKNIPGPVDSQKYRIPKIWKGTLTSEVGKAMMRCDDNGPMVMCITAVKSFPDEGLVATGRLFSGTVKQGQMIYGVNAEERSQLQKVSFYMSSIREPANEIPAGNIAAVTGLTFVRVGETIIDAQCKDLEVALEGFRHIPRPIMTVAVEPRNPKDLERLIEALKSLGIEDSDLRTSVDRETGQYLISGLGELHLEVAVNLLKQYNDGMELKVGKPIASYRETISKKGSLVMAASPNRLNEFWVQVEPLEDETIEFIEKNEASSPEKLKTKVSGLIEQEVWAFDEHVNVLVDSTGNENVRTEVADGVLSGFHWACRTGPLCEQPLRGAKIVLVKVTLSPDKKNKEPPQIERGTSRAILGSFLTAKPVLLQPIFRIEVSAPIEWLGSCSNLIIHRGGKIVSKEQRGTSVTVVGYIPVAKTFELSAEMRSATSGYVSWELVFDHWERMPDKLASESILELRKKKGLPQDIPKPETFVDKICS